MIIRRHSGNGLFLLISPFVITKYYRSSASSFITRKAFFKNTLRKILLSKLDEESQAKLIQLYKDNLDFWTKLGYGAIEILDDIVVANAQGILTDEENTIYKQVKNTDNLIKIATPVLKRIIDKYFAAT